MYDLLVSGILGVDVRITCRAHHSHLSEGVTFILCPALFRQQSQENERLAKISSILENENVMINIPLNTCAFPKDEYEIMLIQDTDIIWYYPIFLHHKPCISVSPCLAVRS